MIKLDQLLQINILKCKILLIDIPRTTSADISLCLLYEFVQQTCNYNNAQLNLKTDIRSVIIDVIGKYTFIWRVMQKFI